MATFFEELDDSLIRFIDGQHVFFVATAPRRGRINLSPKGMDTFRCLDRRTVAYLDLTGSGNETAAHLDENGRITIMFCSFGKKPLILRLYGKGRVLRRGHRRFKPLLARFGAYPGVRQIMLVDITSLQTSCGFGVPRFERPSERPTLAKWTRKRDDAALAEYHARHNTRSIDGRPIRAP